MKAKYLILLGAISQYFSMLQTNSNATYSKAYESQMIEAMKQQGMTKEQIDIAMSSIRQHQDMQQKPNESDAIVEEVENAEASEDDVNLTSQMKAKAKEELQESKAAAKAEAKAQAKEQLNEATEEAKQEAKDQLKDTATECLADACVFM